MKEVWLQMLENGEIHELDSLHYLMFSAQSWHMPDGTKTSTKPRDGAIYNQYDSKGNATTWQWDGVDEKWFNVSSGKPGKTGTATFFMYPGTQPSPIELDNLDWEGGPLHKSDLRSKKCDCGSEHVGSPRHSSWCSKYDPKQ